MTPSPKEKAKELFKDMYAIIFDIDNGASAKHDQSRYDAAKRAAVKSVDEILDISYFTNNPTEEDELYKNYYQEVKEELEKL